MLGRELLHLISTNTTYLCFTGPAYKKEKDKKEKTHCFCVVFIVAFSVSNEYHYAAMNIMDLIIVLELEPFSFCGVTCHNIPALICCILCCIVKNFHNIIYLRRFSRHFGDCERDSRSMSVW